MTLINATDVLCVCGYTGNFEYQGRLQGRVEDVKDDCSPKLMPTEEIFPSKWHRIDLFLTSDDLAENPSNIWASSAIVDGIKSWNKSVGNPLKTDLEAISNEASKFVSLFGAVAAKKGSMTSGCCLRIAKT